MDKVEEQEQMLFLQDIRKTEHNRELTRALLGLERAAKQGEVLGGTTFRTP